MRRLVSLLAGIAVLITLGAAKCEPNGTCKPGDTRGAHGHTEVCNSDGHWAPYVKPTVRPNR